MAKASGLIDLKAIGDASKVATNCIYEFSSAGIWVTPADYKPDSNGDPITTGNNPTVGTKIDNTGVSIYSAGKRMALYGSTTQFFIPGTDNVATEIGSNGLVINEGIISIGQKTSANDVTNNGTYIDVNGNMATSNIKAHGGTIGDWSITSDAITKSGTKTIVFYTLNDDNVVVSQSYSSTYTSSLTSGEMRVQSQFTDNDNLIHKFTNLYGNYLHIEESTGTGMFQLSSAVNMTSRGMSLYDKNSNYVEISTDGNIKTSGDIIGTVSKTTITSFTSGWAVYDSDSTVTLRKRGGVVTLTGGLKNTSAVTLNTSNTAVFTIPEGYRPSQRMAFITQGTGSNIFLVVIETNGTVEFSRYRDTGSSSANSYSSIAAGAWFPFHTTWIMD